MTERMAYEWGESHILKQTRMKNGENKYVRNI